MKITTYILTILILFIGCKESIKPIKEYEFQDIQQKEEIYSLINEFILDSLFRNSVVSIDAMSFCNEQDDDTISLMPPGFFYCYDEWLIDTLIKAKIIDSVDLKCFGIQMKQLNKLKWDSLKLKVKTVSRDTLWQMNLREQDIYKYVTDKYHARGFIILSTPLFSKNGEVIVMSVANFCGGLCGGGIVYAFKKIDNKWHILYYDREWIS